MINNKTIYEYINNTIDLVIKWISLIIVTIIFTLICLTKNYLFISAISSILLYVIGIYGLFFILSYLKTRKIERLSISDNNIIKRALFSILGFFMIVIIGLILNIVISFYISSPKYIKTEINIEDNISKQEISNLPNNPSLNNYLLRKFWENAELEKKKEKKKNSLESKENDDFFELKNIIEDYKVNIIGFNLFTLFEIDTDIAIKSGTLIKDKSLLDTFSRKDEFGDKTNNCFVNDLDEYFYNNEFKMQINSKKVVFYSLYNPPIEKIEFKKQIIKIITGCKKE